MLEKITKTTVARPRDILVLLVPENVLVYFRVVSAVNDRVTIDASKAPKANPWRLWSQPQEYPINTFKWIIRTNVQNTIKQLKEHA